MRDQSPYPEPSSLIGAHLSIAKGLDQALFDAQDLGSRVVQVFTRNARTWKETMPSAQLVDAFHRARQVARIYAVLSHCTYLINIASNDKIKNHKSKAALEAEFQRSARLNIDHVVLHPGAHMGLGEKKGLETALKSLNQVLSNANPTWPRLLLETTAGQGTCLGHRFEHLAWILDRLESDHPCGVCLDTSHIFAAGYDLSHGRAYDKTMEELDRAIGFNRVFALHLNDSKTHAGSKTDRHEHIGKGRIGLPGFQMIMSDSRFKSIPKILETPKFSDATPMDPVNLSLLRKMI